MAKIKISESELKQIIRESVENVLNEAPYDYSKSWEDMSQDERDAVADKQWWRRPLRPFQSTSKQMANAQRVYTDQRNKMISGNKPIYTQAQYDEIKNLYNETQAELKQYKASYQQFQQENQTLSDNLNALYAAAGNGRTPAPDQNTAVGNINSYKTAASRWYNYQKQLKTQQAQAAAQPAQQQTNQRTENPAGTYAGQPNARRTEQIG